MAGKKRAARREQPLRRRALRYPVQAPLDVTVVRSGVPNTLPGRAVNVGERGFAAVLAGEVELGEAVGVEIRLPQSAGPLRTRALVRYYDKLRCGMEFAGLSVEQLAVIRDWVAKGKVEPEAALPATSAIPAGKGSERGRLIATAAVRARRGKGWMFLLGSAAVLLAVLWWRWNAVWAELESDLPAQTAGAEQPQVKVSAEEMEKLVIHRVDPDYPEEARPENLQGVIVLDVVVGREGTVTDVRAQNGPEVLAHAATEALRWWRFEPYRVNGQPVAVETTVAVEFKP
jgi:TonB family protein